MFHERRIRKEIQGKTKIVPLQVDGLMADILSESVLIPKAGLLARRDELVAGTATTDDFKPLIGRSVVDVTPENGYRLGVFRGIETLGDDNEPFFNIDYGNVAKDNLEHDDTRLRGRSLSNRPSRFHGRVGLPRGKGPRL